MGRIMVEKIIELEEEKNKIIPKASFDEKLALTIYRLYKKQIKIEFPNLLNNQCYKLRSKGYIGHIPLSKDIMIRIYPKIPISNLFRMLEYVYDLNIFQLLDGITHIESLNDLFENLAFILSKMVLDRARKGLYRAYITEESSLPYIRGKIKLFPSLFALLGGSTRLVCEYEEHSADLDDNRILLWTIYLLSRLNLKRDDVRKQIRQAYRVLVKYVKIKPMDQRDCILRFYNRLNDDYKPMHAICRLFLEKIGPGIETGTFEFIPFMLNMPKLFESFVAKWLQANLPSEMHINTQYKVELDEKGLFSFKIDLIIINIQSDKILAVLDTKYKRNERLEESDIQQIVAYAVRMQTKKAFLIYPSPKTKLYSLTIGEVKVKNLIFNIGIDPDEAGNSFLENLKNEL